MEIDGQVTISLKTFNQLQDRAKQADELKKKMQDLQEEITDIIDQIDESEAEPIFREIDDNNMTDKQIQKRFDEAIAKFRIILDPEKTKRLIQKYIEKDRSDSHADVKNASRKVLEQNLLHVVVGRSPLFRGVIERAARCRDENLVGERSPSRFPGSAINGVVGRCVIVEQRRRHGVARCCGGCLDKGVATINGKHH